MYEKKIKRMYYLKIILAVWTAVFLALPVCPCQLFGPLGIDFPHRHVEGSASEVSCHDRGPLELTTAPAESEDELPICHCHDSVAKTAEESEESELEMPTKLFASLACLEDTSFSMARGGLIAARAPPPEVPGCFVLTRSKTGVYQL